MKLDPFYLIVDSADWVARLVPLGVKLLQLRVKDSPEPVLRHEIRSAKAICDRHNCLLIINDHWQLAIEEGCTFVHLGQEDLETADRAEIGRAGVRLGLSTHDLAELEIAIAAQPDYIALGPIHSTILKKMKWAPQGPERLAIWRQRIGMISLVAIGGLNPDRLHTVFAHGADSAAVVTDVTLSADPEARTRQWIKITERWRHH